MFKYASFILFLESLGYKNVFINRPMLKATWTNPHVGLFEYTGDNVSLPRLILITLYANGTGMLTPILISWSFMSDCAEVDNFTYRNYNDAIARLETLAERG